MTYKKILVKAKQMLSIPYNDDFGYFKLFHIGNCFMFMTRQEFEVSNMI